MQLNFINSITIISGFQTIFLAISFFLKKGENRQTNTIFSVVLLVFACQIAILFASGHWSYPSSVYSKFYYLIYQTAYLPGPLLYFYIRSASNTDYSFRTKEIAHLVPFILISAFMFILLYGFNIRPEFIYIRLAVIIYSAIYVVVSIVYLQSGGGGLISLFKNRIAKAVDFVKFILVFYIMLWLISLQLFQMAGFFALARWGTYVSNMYVLSVFIIINAAAILLMIDPHIFLIKQKYSRSSLSEQDKGALFNRLMNYMKVRKPYLEPNLSLKELGIMMGVPAKNISQVINEKLDQNFNDFVNIFRIEEAKKYLNDSSQSHLTIQEIFYRCGFNSKSTFNLVFKNYTGLTPVGYRKKQSSMAFSPVLQS
jgi:AraC-like DNA-binding protein